MRHIYQSLWLSKPQLKKGQITHTVTNDDSVDEQGQESVLVLGSVLLEKSSRVVVADGGVLRTALLGRGNGSRTGESESRETHLGCSWKIVYFSSLSV
jgi:hypothetical protein